MEKRVGNAPNPRVLYLLFITSKFFLFSFYVRLFSVVEFYGRVRPRDPVTLTTGDIVLTTYGMVGYEFAKLKKRKSVPARHDNDNNGNL
jgi:hypothetical protein